MSKTLIATITLTEDATKEDIEHVLEYTRDSGSSLTVEPAGRLFEPGVYEVFRWD